MENTCTLMTLSMAQFDNYFIANQMSLTYYLCKNIHIYILVYFQCLQQYTSHFYNAERSTFKNVLTITIYDILN